jgi:hypothetical protein
VSQLRLQARGRPRRHDTPRTQKHVAKTKHGVSQPRLQARGRPRRHDTPRTQKHVAKTKHGVSQLRLQARGRSARGGLAGRSWACKRGFGLALPRAGGERHCARSRVASNRARGTGGHTPRGGWKPGQIQSLGPNRGLALYGPRERERERDASAMPMHLPTGLYGRAAIPVTYVSTELTRKQLPHRSDSGPSPKRTPADQSRPATAASPKPDLCPCAY